MKGKVEIKGWKGYIQRLVKVERVRKNKIIKENQSWDLRVYGPLFYFFIYSFRTVKRIKTPVLFFSKGTLNSDMWNFKIEFLKMNFFCGFKGNRKRFSLYSSNSWYDDYMRTYKTIILLKENKCVNFLFHKKVKI